MNSTSRALYAPPALRRFAVTHGEASGVVHPKDIATERFRQRLNVHNSNVAPPPHQLHRHFVTGTHDRRLATHEAIGDIRDAVRIIHCDSLTLTDHNTTQVTGMDNVADVIFVGFAIRPEWNLSEPLDPSLIHVETVTSHHIQQHPVYQRVVDDMREVIKERIGFPHIYTYHKRLHSVTPGCGYVVDAETGRIRDNAIRLAQGVRPPRHVNDRLGMVSTGELVMLSYNTGQY